MKLNQSSPRKITFFILVCFLLFNISSIGQNYYVPNDANLVALNQRNDFHFSGTINPFSDSKKIQNLQLGYSPLNHIGISSSYFNSNHLNEIQSISYQTKSEIYDIALGGYIFHPMVVSTDSEKEIKGKGQNILSRQGVVFDLYVGHAQGDIRNFYGGLGSNHFRIQKDYIQFGAHARFKFIEIHLATRIGRLSFSEGIVQGRQNHSILNALEIFDIDNDFTIIEHTFRVHAGIKYGQIIISVSRVNSSNQLYRLGVINNASSIGVNINIDEFFRNGKKDNNKLVSPTKI